MSLFESFVNYFQLFVYVVIILVIGGAIWHAGAGDSITLMLSQWGF